MAENPNLDVLQRFVAAVFAGDADTLKGLCHPDFQLHEGSGLSFGGVYPGGAGFLDFLEIFGSTLEIEQLETVRIYRADDPDYLISEMELRSSLRASGERFDSSLLEKWTFRDGRVIEIRPHYFNAMQSRA